MEQWKQGLDGSTMNILKLYTMHHAYIPCHAYTMQIPYTECKNPRYIAIYDNMQVISAYAAWT